VTGRGIIVFVNCFTQTPTRREWVAEKCVAVSKHLKIYLAKLTNKQFRNASIFLGTDGLPEVQSFLPTLKAEAGVLVYIVAIGTCDFYQLSLAIRGFYVMQYWTHDASKLGQGGGNSYISYFCTFITFKCQN